MVLLLHNPSSPDDKHVVSILDSALRAAGLDIFVDRRREITLDQARISADWIKSAECVVAIISPEASESETLEFQLETVAEERRLTSKPLLVTIRIRPEESVTGPMAAYAASSQIFWSSRADDAPVADAVRAAVTAPAAAKEPKAVEDTASAPSPATRFYTLRPSDADLDTALWARESVVLIRGPRQIGKTSLIGRGIELASAMNWRTVSTDFQKLNSFQLNDVDRFCQLLAKTMARQLRLDYDFDTLWVDDFGPNLNLDHFVKTAIEASDEPLVWFMDEADRIFTAPFASDFYGLVRSWHNARATDPSGPWSRFTVVIGYATEARLFIQDLNQSPFNVGVHLTLESFNLHQTTDLNLRFGGPLKRKSDLEGLQFLLGGHPMLTKRALELITNGKLSYSQLIDTADQDDGPFGDHLKRVLYAISLAPDVLDTLRSSLAFIPLSTSNAAERLISAGVLREAPDGKAVLACDLYSQFLARHIH